MARQRLVIPLSESTLRRRMNDATDEKTKKYWKILLLSRQGKSRRAVAEEVGYTPAWITTLIRRFLDEGEDALRDRRKDNPGRQPTLSAGQLQSLTAALEDRQRCGKTISGPYVRQWIIENCEWNICLAHSWRILRQLGFRSVRRPRTEKIKEGAEKSNIGSNIIEQNSPSSRTDSQAALTDEESSFSLSRPRYPSDVSDEEWAILGPLLEVEGGRKMEYSLREVVNAIFYRLRSGCQWEMLPHDFPPWKSVWYHYNKWIKRETWQHVNDALRGKVRQQLGRNEQPSAVIADSQSVKTTEKGGFADMMGIKK